VLGILLFLLTKEKYQNILLGKATKYLSEKLKTRVHIDHVKFGFFNHFDIQGVYVEDQQKDTLAYIGTLRLKTSELLSNYWNDEPFVVHDVTLKDVFVNLNRQKSSDRWNYDFISEAFASADTSQSAEDTLQVQQSTEPEAVKLELKTLNLENFRFFMDDAWRGEDMRFVVEALDLDVKTFDLLKARFEIPQLDIHQADVLVREYEGGKPEDLTPDDTSTWGTPFNPDLAGILIQDLNLTDSRFRYLNGDEKPKPGEFDESQLDISQIQLHLSNTRLIADTLFAQIDQLSAKERCGLEVKNLKAQAKVSQVESILDQLYLETANSKIQDHFAMKYRNFHDFNDFIEKVKMEGNLKDAHVSSLDIGYFANIINQYPILVHLDGQIEGTVDQIEGRNLKIQSSETSFKGNAMVRGLPDIDQTFFDVQVDELLTNGKDLNRLIPQTRVDAVAWNDLKTIRFQGKYSGQVDEFKTNGILQTNLGRADLDLAMNFKPKTPTYKGHIATKSLNLGRLIKQSSIGNISVDANLDGQGFSLEDIKAKVLAKIDEIEIDGKKYIDLNINGLVENKKFDGIFVSQDPSLTMNFNVKLDLSGKDPSYQFSTRFIRFNLQKMGITTEPVIGSGYATLDFTGSSIDDFHGKALFTNLTLENGLKVVKVDEINLQSFETNQFKTITLNSSVADAELKGQFKVSEMSDAVLYYLSHYLPQYISKPAKYSPQNFVFEVTMKEIDPLLQTFVPELRGLNGSNFSGELNTYQQKLGLDMVLPGIQYDQLTFKDITLVGAGDFKSFELTANGGNFLYENELMIPSFQFTSSMADDTASLSLVTQSMNDLLGEASLNCKATASNGKLFVDLLPSNINLKTDPWQIYSKQALVFGEQIEINELYVESGAQKIKIQSENTLESDHLYAELQNLDLYNLTGYANISNPVWNGRISGRIDALNYMESPLIKATIYSTNEVRVDQDTVGMVKLQMDYDVNSQKLTLLKGTGILRGENKAGIEGFINMKDSLVDITATLEETLIAFANQFISEYIRNLRGQASGKVLVKGVLDNPKISGDIQLKDASLKVLFLGTTYSIPQMKFSFNNQNILVQETLLKDERLGNYTGILSGKIAHRNFSDMYLDFSLKSDNLLCLNTSEYDNSLFYGYVPAAVNMKLNGPMNDIDMDIQTRPLKNSKFYLPLNSTGDASTYDYVRFTTYGRIQGEEDVEDPNPSYVKINMNIEATPDAEVYMILDKNTGEEIIARGEGAIRLFVDLGNDISMNGNYAINDGKYLFNFRGLFNKEFNIDEGSKITWSGDVLGAELDVKAVYKTQKPLPLYPLVSNIAESLDETDKTEAKKAYPTFVSILLSGPLSLPNITFDITQPDNKSVGSAAFSKLEQIKNDEKELVSQAGVLLLFEQFKAPEGISNSAYGQGVVSTVSDVVSSAVSSELTNQFQKITGLDKVTFNLNYQNINSLEEGVANRNQLSMNITTTLFKDRVVVDFGNSVDIGRDAQGNTTSSFNLGGDFKAQFLITEDGRFRANAFRTNNVNLENTNFTKGGLGLSYKIVYNSFADLLQPKRKKQEKNSNSPTESEGILEEETKGL
jgi:hypothetical protein